MKNLLETIRKITTEINRLHLSAFAAQATLFIVLSAFPFLILLLGTINILSLSANDLIANLDLFLPPNIIPAVTSIIYEIADQQTTSVYIISTSIVTTLWSSGRCFVAIRHALNSVNRTKETRNFIAVRIISSIYTFGLIFFLLLLLMFPVLNTVIYNRVLISFAVLFLFFMLLYRAVPNVSFPLRSQIPGAVFSASGWLLFSFFFFLYTTYLSNMSRIYGRLSVIVVFILWLYFCMYILLLGADLNYHLFTRKHSNKNNSLKC